MPNLIERISGLLEKATPQKWSYDTYNTVWAGSESTKDLVEICTIPYAPETGDSPKRSSNEWVPQATANAALIPELRNAAPAIMDALKAAKEVDAAATSVRKAKVSNAENQGPLLRDLENALDALRSKLAALEEL